VLVHTPRRAIRAGRQIARRAKGSAPSSPDNKKKVSAARLKDKCPTISDIEGNSKLTGAQYSRRVDNLTSSEKKDEDCDASIFTMWRYLQRCEGVSGCRQQPRGVDAGDNRFVATAAQMMERLPMRDVCCSSSGRNNTSMPCECLSHLRFLTIAL